MNLHALRIFSKVADFKSVTKAADALRISQPAVTVQIRNLEKEIGLRLIETKGRGIKLTKEGEYLNSQAQSIFNMEQDIERKLVHLKNGDIQGLRIASTYLPANFLLPVWLATYKMKFPSVKVNLYSGNSDEVIENLLDYKSDIAFIVKEEWNHPDLYLEHLMDIDFWFVVPQGHKYEGKEVSLYELMREPFLLREEGSSTRDILFSLCKIHSVPLPAIGLQYHGLNESIRSVVAGYGTMLAPALAVEDYVKRGEIGRVTVHGIEVRRPVYICSRKRDKEYSDNLHRFIDYVKSSHHDDPV
ncbi:LysR family transcriptional regulator [Sporosarcina sp. Te-1]|uniref:LysR family transcriptional regulator n=1 Tax=Sporosarcina sp. Te-1 TaxID=2818390 RepID=UPI001AA00274|nr:LysR family transcriptional regulator [Sporosarcina sp. Te-1]QTD42036.1 LysR family transcriptional regulator [Sporosarcina sp. Te-1]